MNLELPVILNAKILTVSCFGIGDQMHPSEPQAPQFNASAKSTKPSFKLFTSTPVSSRLKTPLFKPKDSKKDIYQSGNTATNDALPTFEGPAAQAGCIIENGLNEIPPDPPPPQQDDLSPVKTVPDPTSKDLSVAEPEEEEQQDQSVFYTPELFEGGEDEEDTLENDQKTPLKMEQILPLPSGATVASSMDVNDHEKSKKRTCADSVDLKRGTDIPNSGCVSPKRDCVLSQSVAGQAGVRYSTGSEDRATRQQQHNSRSRRLSRSRQKALSKPAAGKITAHFHCLSQPSQPDVFAVDD